MKQNIDQLIAKEIEIIQNWHQSGLTIIDRYNDGIKGIIYDDLDTTFEKWVYDIKTKPSSDELIAGLGAVFGNSIINDYKTSWQKITDKYGSDYAVIFYGFQMFPFSFITKRVNTITSDTPEFGFFRAMNSLIKNKFK